MFKYVFLSFCLLYYASQSFAANPDQILLTVKNASISKSTKCHECYVLQLDRPNTTAITLDKDLNASSIDSRLLKSFGKGKYLKLTYYYDGGPDRIYAKVERWKIKSKQVEVIISGLNDYDFKLGPKRLSSAYENPSLVTLSNSPKDYRTISYTSFGAYSFADNPLQAYSRTFVVINDNQASVIIQSSLGEVVRKTYSLNLSTTNQALDINVGMATGQLNFRHTGNIFSVETNLSVPYQSSTAISQTRISWNRYNS